MKFPLMLIACLFAQAALAATPPIEPTMVKIPGGQIETAACPAGITVCPEHEYVMQTVAVAPFEMAATEVTFAEWDACVEDGACTSPVSDWAYKNRPVAPPCVEDAPCQYPDDGGWGRGKRPVINVSWNDVQGYLAWLNARTGKNYRLPTAAEWEYAALAGATTTFPWGDKIGKNKANCDGCGSKWDGGQTAPVASFKPNRFGLHDTVGNVAEWVNGCIPSRKEGSRECNTYIYRGGGWPAGPAAVDPRNHHSLNEDLRMAYIGFRLAR